MTIDKEKAKQQIKGLVDKYNKVVEEGKLKKYNEEMTKKDFILPLFRALGWNVENSSEVTAEEKISKKRVDYGFRINGIPKFFLEAKTLKIDLDNSDFIKQAIDYAWHKGCTWAVLTNFKEIRIYNAEWKVYPLQAHLKTIHYHEFLDRFEELWLLSKESFEKGLLDREAEKWGKKAKKIPIDKQLLTDFTKFRELLSKNIKKHQPDISKDLLDESVQRILDRLIFIRVCEDREIEPIVLRPKVREYEENWRKMKKTFSEVLSEVFRYFDSKYNSKLFKEHYSEKLKIDSDILIDVIKRLYKSSDGIYSYNFSIIDADVLGNIYEQYLGHILKGEKRIKLKEAHKHRKEQGIYYTPTYIVDYIVKNTISKLTKGKSLDEILEIKVLDPACGSGSFLIKAFSELCKIVEDRMEAGERSEKVISFKKYNDRLSISQKIYILTHCIFGVDLDERAVEIAQLNLLLKILEGESTKTLSNIKEMKKLLPMLDKNIKCGNSLIDDPAIAGDKAFKWEEEFKEIMDEGGFDVVIGNPPYVNVYLLSRNKKEMKYYQLNYYSAYKKFDLYVLFIEKAIISLKNGGFFSFIIPDKFLLQPYGKKIRKFILENCKILKIVDLTGFKIFEQATVDNIILVLQKENNRDIRNKNKIKIVKPLNNPLRNRKIEEDVFEIAQKIYLDDRDFLFRINVDSNKLRLKNKIEKDSTFVRDICYVNWGARSGNIKKFVVKEKINNLCKPMLDGRDINRYAINYKGKYLIYDTKKLYNPMFKELFEKPKIMIRDINAREGLKATYDEDSYYAEHTLSICMPFHQLKGIKRRGLKITSEQINKSKNFHLKYILAILNSKLITFYFKTFIGCGLHVYPDNIRALPIKNITLKEQQPFIKLVDKMLSLNKRLNEIGDKRTDERARIEEEIKKTDKEIDELVYKIYGITEEEKKIIEESLK